MTLLSPRVTLAVVALGVVVALAAALAPDLALGSVHLRHVLGVVAGACSWLAGAGRSFVRAVDRPDPSTLLKEIPVNLEAILAAVGHGPAKAILDGLIAQVAANEPAILAKLAGANQTLANALENDLVAALKAQPTLAPIADIVDVRALAASAEAAAVAEAGSIEKAAFDYGLAKLRSLVEA